MFETLEQRQLLSINPVISEFMASNSTTLKDYYGNYSDWLEVFNPDTAALSFSGWKLQDNSTTWTIPAGVTIPAKGYLKIFCDNRDTVAPNGELHTNFKLGAGGDYLGLLKPDNTVVSQYSPEYPEQFTDVSYGLAVEENGMPLVGADSTAKAFVPTTGNGGSTLGDTWKGAPATEPFNDSSWLSGATGAGMFASASPIQASSLKLRLNADSLFGATVPDTSGAGHDGTNVGASWAQVAMDSQTEPATRSGVIRFNAAENDQITVAPNADFYNSTHGTISFWMCSSGTTGSGTDGAVLFDLRSNRGMLITQTNGGKIRVRCYRSGGSIECDFTSSASVSDNRWHHVAVVFDRDATHTSYVYIDGTSSATGTNGSNGWTFSTGNPIEIGRCSISNHTPSLATSNYNGYLDDYRFYNTALSSGDIGSIANRSDEGVTSLDAGIDVKSAMQNVNPSAFVRYSFTLDDPNNISNLRLTVRYCDGFVVWINGVQVASRNTPASPVWNSSATAVHSSNWSYTGVIDDLSGLNLHAGTNILAIQGLNNTTADGSFLIAAQLSANLVSGYGTDARYFVTPTPGAKNSTGTADLGPIVSDVSHPATQPSATDQIVVTARVSPTFTAIQAHTVTLNYRVMHLTPDGNGVYQEDVYAAEMFDDHTHGDAVSGDGIYTAIIPSGIATAGQMVRWYVSASDTTGRSGRWPLLVPIVPENQDGGPQYEGTVIADPSFSSALPVFQTFFASQTDMANANDWTNRPAVRCSVFYLGRFYDNVYVRCRGGYTTNGNKFKFNSGYDFVYAEDEPAVTQLNLNQGGWDETLMRPTVAFETAQQAGVPASNVFPVRVQRNGSYYMVMSLLEQFDDRLLDREGIYKNGAIYKCYTPDMDPSQVAYDGYFDKENRDEVAGKDDLVQFFTGLHLTDATAKKNYIYDHVNIPEMLDYMAANVLYLDNDQAAKNYYLYCDTNDGTNATYNYANANGTNEWGMAPWDKDLTFGKNYGFADYSTPDPQAHPFFGDSNHPKSDGPYNWLMDALLDIPEIKQMYLRRLRTMMDEFLQPPGTVYTDRFFEARFDELYARLMSDPVVQSAMPSLQSYLNDIKTRYLDPRRNHLYIDHSLNTSYPDYAGIPAEQAAFVQVNFGAYEVSPASGNQDQEYLTLTNPNSFAVDISGWKLSGGVSLTFDKGVVIPAGGTLYVSPNVYAFRQRTTGPGGGQSLLVQGNYDGHLSKNGDSVQLVDTAGTVVAMLATPSNPSLAQQYLRVTEVMYHPAAPGSGSYTADDFQFIELKNTSATQTLSLAGVRFTDGVSFDFTGSSVTSLAPGARALVVSNLAAFQSRYGTGLNGIIAGTFAKQSSTDLDITHLAHSGEKLTLVDSVGETILSFSYQDGWFKQTDGSGNSLVIRDAAAADRSLWGRSEGWAASHAANGSPGADETPGYAVDAIVVNELLSHRTDESGGMGDWVEFYNTTSSAINIGGWYLSNDDADLKKYQVPAGTSIPAHGYTAFNWRDNFGSTANPGCTTPFTLGEMGGNVYLTSAVAGVLTEFQANESFGSIDTGVTFGRYIKSTGGKDFVATSSPTYEAPNATPAVGPVVINEIYYHPTSGKDSFIELKNVTGLAVPLYDPARPQNTWHLREGVEFDFPVGASIPANGYALVVNVDPAYYRAKYSIPASVPIYGPYLYELSNGGDTVELKYPDDPQPDGDVPYDRMDQVTYEDGGLWPSVADGFRASLSRVSATAYGNDAANWSAGWPTPGAANGAFTPGGITLETPATATPGVINGTTTNLSALADSTIGGSLRYDWSVTAMPTSAPVPVFSVNHSSAAADTVATFGKAGTYTFTVMISNIFIGSITSSVTVVVNQVMTGMSLLPSAPLLVPSATQQFTAFYSDQFGNCASGQSVPVTWSLVSGGGQLTAGGLYTAPGSATTATIQGTGGGYTATATVQVGNPLAYWKFDEISGSTAADSSGNNHPATLNGGYSRGTVLLGMSAITFNGSTGYASAAIDIPETEYAVSVWFKTTSPNGGLFGVVDGTQGSNGHDRHIYLSNGNIVVRVWDTEIISTTGLNLADNKWHNVVHTVGSSIGGQKIYVDGVLRASGYKTYSDFTWQTAVDIGFSNDASPNYFSGTIDDVRIYGTALTAGSAAYLASLQPTNIGLTNNSVAENTAGATVGTLTTVDQNTSDTYTYTLRSDPTSKFEIANTTLRLKAGQSLNYQTTPTVLLSIRSYNSAGQYFDKDFTIYVTTGPGPMVVTAADWATWGTTSMTLKYVGDGKLHIYKTGTTTDIVAPRTIAATTYIDVTGRGTGDVLVVAPMGPLGPSITVHSATLTVTQDNAIPAGTGVTIDAGAMDLAGHAVSFGILTIASGQVTVPSISGESLVIGNAVAAGKTPPGDRTKVALDSKVAIPNGRETSASAADGVAGEERELTIPIASPIPGVIAAIAGAVIEQDRNELPARFATVTTSSDWDAAPASIIVDSEPEPQSVEEFSTPATLAAVTERPPELRNGVVVGYVAFPGSFETMLAATKSTDVRPATDWRGAATAGRPANDLQIRVGAKAAHLAALQSVIEEYWERYAADDLHEGLAKEPAGAVVAALDAALTSDLD